MWGKGNMGVNEKGLVGSGEVMGRCPKICQRGFQRFPGSGWGVVRLKGGRCPKMANHNGGEGNQNKR